MLFLSETFRIVSSQLEELLEVGLAIIIALQCGVVS